MASELFSSELLSHPDKPLIKHLKNVGDFCRDTVTGKQLNFDDITLLSKAAYIIGATHDLGKATAFFQEYIREKDEKRKKVLKARETTHHGLLSALFAYAVIKEYLNQSGKEGWLAKYLPIISFIVVRRHHGNLINALSEIDDVYSNRENIQKLAREQIKAIEGAKVEEILQRLLKNEVDIKIDFNNIINYVLGDAIEDISRKDCQLVIDLVDEHNLNIYFFMQFLYSSLLDADKTDAGLDGFNFERFDISSDLVDRYKAMKFPADKNNINDLRNRIYVDTMEGIKSWDLNSKIISLNVPTGTGKTLTAFSLALKLRERLKKEHGFTARIVYALPFLSIIDQNFDVFEDVITKAGCSKDSRLLLKHHHLADVDYRVGDESYEADKSLLLMEGWNAEIIVTTFWQFFHTLFSNRNKQLRKFNKLANSIIILDEVQAVPHRYWQLIHDAMVVLCEKFNSYVIFVTATQPLIFDESKGEIKEIVQNKEKYFQDLDRIELIPRLDKLLTLEEFKALVKERLVEQNDKDFLIVLNTISSANDVYSSIKDLKLENTRNFYLSTHIVPKKRLEKIKEIKESSGCRKVIVSTQLIEAGVDIDADVVYRDFAPLDSLNQVAGRCNRNSMKSTKGSVSIFRLKDERKEYYKYIYDTFLTINTLDILKTKEGPIHESDFLELNNKYFKIVKMGMGKEKSRKNLAFLMQLAFKDLSKEFKLIEEDFPKVDVFVELDESASGIWKKYLDLQSEKNGLERMKKHLSIKKEFNDYMISVPEKYACHLVNDDSEIGYISKEELDKYYDPETGFKRTECGECCLIL